MKQKLILASASPRRAAILKQLGIPFEVQVSQVQEENVQGPIHLQAEQLALAKARAVAQFREGLILGADTVVAVEGEILGKPEDEADAVRMLQKLSGKEHQVVTGLALVEGKGGREFCSHELTFVQMRPLSREEILRYVATGEPLDKAGAYGIQGLGAALVREIRGCYYNVVGLPVGLLVDQLANFGIAVP
ncbi:MAG: septum formation inhibitor Maf [Firmicutes bacterium]|jgi:septum formation protein|nr:septum formation inhibitor Maf [Bacillota bacterium]HOB22016.1 Maf family protein [Bacillota bacterium]HQD40301.1 Maf family protein [Bacillota bacterium]